MKKLIILLSLLLAFAIFVMPIHATDVTFTCTPLNGAYIAGERLHVHCDSSYYDVSFFAFPVHNIGKDKKEINPEADTIMSIITTAVVENKNILIVFDPDDLSGVDIGCQENDCRLIKEIVIVK